MDLFEYKLSKGVNKIAFIGDIHYGSPLCDMDLLKRTIKQVKKDNVRVVLMGDLIENGTRDSVCAGVYEQEMNPSEQIKELIELFYPIRKNILSSISGNHEVRSFKSSGLNVAEIIASSLGCNFSNYMLINRFQNDVISYDVFSWHGKGGGSVNYNKVRNLLKQSDWVDADVYSMGHVHELYHISDVKRIISEGDFMDVMRHFVLTGSFLRWDDSYAECAGLRPSKLGSPLLLLDGSKRKIDIDLEWVK